MEMSYAVLGLGAYGRSLTEALFDEGADVLIADRDEETVEQYASKSTYAMTADLTDAKAIMELGLENMDVVIVCMSQSLEASIMCTMVAKEAGVKRVIAKASNARMADILKKVGADEVVNIEEDAAFRMARSLISDNFIDYFDLGGNLCLVDYVPKPEWIGKNLRELRLRDTYQINVVAIKEDGETSGHIDPDIPIRQDSHLIIVVEKKDLKRLL